MIFLKSDDFFKVLKEQGIRKKDSEHENLREFFQLNEENKDLLVLKRIKQALEQMAENDHFMSAIQADIDANFNDESHKDNNSDSLPSFKKQKK